MRASSVASRQLRLRPVAGHVFAEDRFHALGMAGAHRVAAGLGGAEPLQMDVADALLVQPGSELALGKARLA